MRKWKILFFITLLALVSTNLVWFYKLIDAAYSYTYQQVSYEESIKSIRLLEALVVKGANKYTKKDILHILRQENKDAFIVEEENLIDVDGVKFIFKNGTLIEVKG